MQLAKVNIKSAGVTVSLAQLKVQTDVHLFVTFLVSIGFNIAIPGAPQKHFV